MIGKSAKSLNEIDQKEDCDRCYQRIQKVLADDNLVCKKVSEGEDSLFRAVSEALYSTSNYSKELQELCIKHLANLITTNQLPRRLEIFRGNSVLWKEYMKNVLSSQFFEINLELISLAFKVRLIVYTVADDGILNGMIFNNKFEQIVQLIRPFEGHFDAVYSQNFMHDVAHCQNILMNVLNRALDGSKESEWKDSNEEKQAEMKSKESSSKDEKRERKAKKQEHKRARSSEALADSQDRLDFYKSFMDSKAQKEISSLVEKDIAKFKGKETALPNLNLINESKPVEKHIAPEDSTGLKLGNVKSIPSKRAIIEEEDELATPDFTNIKLEKSKSCMVSKGDGKSPLHFINALPPGLTPNRYSTKTYGNDDFTQAAANTTLDKQVRRYSHMDEDPHQLLNPNAAKPRNPNRTLSLTLQSDEFRKNFGNLGGPIPEHEYPQGLQKNPTPEKKKPVILDESHQRYTGRLKFFDEAKNYGFIVMDDDGSDIFVHYDDLHKANITKDFLKTSKFGNSVRLTFSCLEYIGKYNRSRKATDIQSVSIN